MARFYPLYVRRSDGRTEIVSKSKRREPNKPTDEQLDQKPDKNGTSDYYREVGIDESKHLDWRRKLGGMLARELDWKDKAAQADAGYMLVAFPENYRLWEHVVKKEKDGQTVVKNKTHAAGGNDRQDAYLYGHPAGRKKRFRSPADFFPHLLWLCTDESGDPDNCGCKICSPDDLDDLVPGLKAKQPAFKMEPATSNASLQRQVSGSVPTKVKQEHAVVASPRAASTSTTLKPTPLAQPINADQQYDLQYNIFVYRPGELVWFRRGQAWGLGAVTRRWKDASHHNVYTVQPLSHPFAHPSTVDKNGDAELRPWLAWSVPRYTTDALNTMHEPARYDNLNWESMMHRKYGSGDPEVDGSILAAKAIDCSYTPLERLKSVEGESGLTETYYNSLFIGAEKIWLSDIVRLQPGTDILVVHSIVERVRSGPQGAQRSTFLVGDIYSLERTRMTTPAAPNPASPSANPHVPQRLTEDLAFRNNSSIRIKGIASHWKLKAVGARMPLDEIKGRWYEASLILPILQADHFTEAARKGEISEATLWMNSRGDCLSANRPPQLPKLPKRNVFKSTRVEAFGRAVPNGTVVREGIEPPVENLDPALEGLGAGGGDMDIDPRFDTAEGQGDVSKGAEMGDGAGVGVTSGGIDEFMDLDGDHDIPGFGQQYSQEASQQAYY